MDNTLMAAMFQTPAAKMSMPFLATAEVKKERVCEIRHGKCLSHRTDDSKKFNLVELYLHISKYIIITFKPSLLFLEGYLECLSKVI